MAETIALHRDLPESLIAVLFCPPCDRGWVESGDHPSLNLLHIKRIEGSDD